MAKRITLFTNFSPTSGGGGTNLRTLVPELRGIQIRWLYTSESDQNFPGATWIGTPIAGGSLGRDLATATILWCEHETARFREVVERLCDDDSDGFWVVGHNEGALVARALCARRRPVHLTIQDDVPDGMFARSTRYRWLSALARPVFYDLLNRVSSFDVTSDGMYRYYRHIANRQGIVVHPYVDKLPAPLAQASAASDTLTVGHIGTLYSVREWSAFVDALASYAASIGRKPRVIMIGLAAKFHAEISAAGSFIEIVGHLAEEKAIDRLSQSDFMYAMYPFDAASEVFRRTSLPTKLTTYLKCRKPLFAHTPMPSSLSELVDRFSLGSVCDSSDADVLRRHIAAVARRVILPEAFDSVREEVYGIDNANRLEQSLLAL